jgi:streptomycin 6-kinase
MASVPAALAPYLRRWNLEVEGRPTSGVSRQGVLFVRRGGERLVLKALGAVGDELRMAQVLTHWDGRGAVRLVEADAGAVLMEQARPGDELTGMVYAGRDDEATAIMCEVMRALDRPAPPASAGVRTVQDWGGGFARNRALAIAGGLEARLIDKAERLYFELCASQGPPILLHGDLHHENVVRDEARGWLAIDPKGILGEAAYETCAMLRNPGEARGFENTTAVIERRARQMSERLGHDYDRIIAWCFAQWVLAALWGFEDGNYGAFMIKGAYQTEPLLRS